MQDPVIYHDQAVDMALAVVAAGQVTSALAAGEGGGVRQHQQVMLVCHGRQKAEPQATSPAGYHEDFSPFSYGFREF